MSAAARHRQRAWVYRALARLFRPPEADGLIELRRFELPAQEAALRALGADASLLERSRALCLALFALEAEQLAAEWEANFEPSGGLICPLGETAHTAESPQEAWLTGYRLADTAGFYRAFGVEVEPGTERPDHLSVELEFMHLLAIKEALAEERGESERAALCREAAVSFLREHLGRWAGKVRDRLEEGCGTVYPRAAAVLEGFVALDTELLGEAARV